MQSTKMFCAIIAATLALAAVQMPGQANVKESQTTLLYVDAVNGLDSNPGTLTMPLQTIQASVLLAQANNLKSIATKVLINPGVYREFVDIEGRSKQTGATMTFESSQVGGAEISASDVLTNWAQDGANPSIYSHPWNYSFHACSVPSDWPSNFAPVTLRTEMIIVNHNPLLQVMSLREMRAGTFFIDAPNDAVKIWPNKMTVMNWALVEAAVRPQTMNVNSVNNIVFRGLIFQHAANCMNTSGAMVNNSSNVLFDEVQAVWNNWGGLGISSSNKITVQNSVASHNGGVGFSAMMDTNALYNYDESDFNNWRGAMGAFYDWGMGGTKLMLMHTAIVSNHYSYANQAQGLWFDTDNKNIAIDNATLSGNVMGGLQAEADEGPISLTNSRLCGNGAGVNVINTAQLTIKDNFFYNNGGTNKYQAEIFIAGKSGGRKEHDWQTGQPYVLYTSAMTINGNTVQNAAAGQFVFGTYLTGDDWTQFANSLSSDSNTWFDASTSKSFKIPDGKAVDLAAWQNDTRTDSASSWSSAPTPTSCAVPTPSFTDFSVNSDNMTYQMAGGKTVVTLHVNSYGYGQVNLMASGLPAGVSASFNPPFLINGSSVLTLTASPKAVAQAAAPITIFANSGGRVHSITIAVGVVPVVASFQAAPPP